MLIHEKAEHAVLGGKFHDCAEQDAYEDDDRKHGRMFRVNRDAGGVFRAYD